MARKEPGDSWIHGHPPGGRRSTPIPNPRRMATTAPCVSDQVGLFPRSKVAVEAAEAARFRGAGCRAGRCAGGGSGDSPGRASG